VKFRHQAAGILFAAFFQVTISASIAAAPAGAGSDCVILLHGMARTAGSMNKMQQSLENLGYAVANIDYPSRDHEIEVLASLAVEHGLNECRNKGDFNAVHFVTHSLGGILVRYYLSKHEIGNLGRVVMLGPPNQGSHAADVMQDLPGFDWLNGPAGSQLGKGPDSIPLQLGAANFDLGVIAGDRSIDPITSAVLENPDDGRVSVEDTKLEGMLDFRVVGTSHAFIMVNAEVIGLVKSFLEHGSFDPQSEADQALAWP
jgi:triacylglycerol lipase